MDAVETNRLAIQKKKGNHTRAYEQTKPVGCLLKGKALVLSVMSNEFRAVLVSSSLWLFHSLIFFFLAAAVFTVTDLDSIKSPS